MRDGGLWLHHNASHHYFEIQHYIYMYIVFCIKTCNSLGLREACAKVCLREACVACARLPRMFACARLARGRQEQHAARKMFARGSHPSKISLFIAIPASRAMRRTIGITVRNRP